ncbi:MAG TPA: hypothetical protein DEB57_06830, partial [Microbacterium sp.]|nr:hypothetical protein [Microbacterium sp.]
MRPIILKGWSELSKHPVAPTMSLEDLYLVAMVGAKLLGVRLRPELTGTENFEAFTQVSESLERGALSDPAEFMQLYAIKDPPPQSLLRSLVPALTSRYYG